MSHNYALERTSLREGAQRGVSQPKERRVGNGEVEKKLDELIAIQKVHLAEYRKNVAESLEIQR